jgi:hypothetical protein
MKLPFWKPQPERWLKSLPQHYRNYQRPAQACGMTSNNELCFLETYAREAFSGMGGIVDLGCWYGATTLSLARGLAARPRGAGAGTITALDLFEWQSWMDPIAEIVALPRRYAAGQSFYEEVRELLRPYAPFVKIEKRDLLAYSPPPAPIEFLFIDAMKSWELAQTIVSRYFPLLIPQRAYVVQQDFAWYHPVVATNHLIMWYLRDYFRCVYHVPDSCSVVYLCACPCEAAALPQFVPQFFTPGMVEEAYAYSLRCVQPNMRVMLEIAKLCFLIQEGRASEAVKQGRRLATLTGVSSAMLNQVELAARERLTTATQAGGGSVEWLREILCWTGQRLKSAV